MRLQQLQQTLQSVLTQKQQVELELLEVDQALGELEKTSENSVIYKSVGSLLIKSEKPKVTDELKEKKELSNMRVSVLGKQEERLRTQIKELNDKLHQTIIMITHDAEAASMANRVIEMRDGQIFSRGSRFFYEPEFEGLF